MVVQAVSGSGSNIMLRALILILLLPFRLLYFAWVKVRARHKDLLLELDIKAHFSEAPLSHGLWSYFKPAKDRFYLYALELTNVLWAVQQKKLSLKTMRITIEPNNLGWAQAWELRQLIKKIGEAGIETHVFLLADDRVSVFIASAASQVYAPETSTFDLSPFTSESLYVQGLLGKLGIRPQFLSVGQFKSAAEIFTRSGMSKAARQQTEELLSDMETTFRSGLADKAPSLGDRKKYTLMGANDAKKEKYIDHIAGYSEFLEKTDPDGKLRRVDLITAQKMIARKNFRLISFKRRKHVALVVAEGNIIETAESRPGTINWPDYLDVSHALKEKHYDAALVRVNSPGGSALVSQLLWREWMNATGKIPVKKNPDAENEKRPKKKKKSHHAGAPIPVFVSQGNVAASGGYYLSAIADKIFATPMTITGSIGVVGGKFNVQPLMKKLGISVDRAPKRNPSPAFSAFSDFNGVQKKSISENMHEVYAQFLRDVAQGRKSEVEKIKPHASGRVYSGRRAATLGLTDHEGGIGAALEALKHELGLKPNEAFELTVLPHVKESLFNRSLLPFGLRQLAALADFAKPGIYALETGFIVI